MRTFHIFIKFVSILGNFYYEFDFTTTNFYLFLARAGKNYWFFFNSQHFKNRKNKWKIFCKREINTMQHLEEEIIKAMTQPHELHDFKIFCKRDINTEEQLPFMQIQFLALEPRMLIQWGPRGVKERYTVFNREIVLNSDRAGLEKFQEMLLNNFFNLSMSFRMILVSSAENQEPKNWQNTSASLVNIFLMEEDDRSKVIDFLEFAMMTHRPGKISCLAT